MTSAQSRHHGNRIHSPPDWRKKDSCSALVFAGLNTKDFSAIFNFPAKKQPRFVVVLTHANK